MTTSRSASMFISTPSRMVQDLNPITVAKEVRLNFHWCSVFVGSILTGWYKF
ncbi:hypothetical protein L208DRAFT_1400448 [Tricholoma matsutake]|nr:hypothetical protein L208DRAFT_1400448 [Tricholoma matsutake 945]